MALTAAALAFTFSLLPSSLNTVEENIKPYTLQILPDRSFYVVYEFTLDYGKAKCRVTIDDKGNTKVLCTPT